MTEPCACAHGVPARAGSRLCAECYQAYCEPGACNRERLEVVTSGCNHSCQHCCPTPLDYSTARSETEYRSRARAEQDYEDEQRRRDEKSDP